MHTQFEHKMNQEPCPTHVKFHVMIWPSPCCSPYFKCPSSITAGMHTSTNSVQHRSNIVTWHTIASFSLVYKSRGSFITPNTSNAQAPSATMYAQLQPAKIFDGELNVIHSVIFSRGPVRGFASNMIRVPTPLLHPVCRSFRCWVPQETSPPCFEASERFCKNPR